MLEHQKKLIQNISHDSQNVQKEFLKSRKWLTEQEFEELKKWMDENHIASIKKFSGEL